MNPSDNCKSLHLLLVIHSLFVFDISSTTWIHPTIPSPLFRSPLGHWHNELFQFDQKDFFLHTLHLHLKGVISIFVTLTTIFFFFFCLSTTHFISLPPCRNPDVSLLVVLSTTSQGTDDTVVSNDVYFPERKFRWDIGLYISFLTIGRWMKDYFINPRKDRVEYTKTTLI